MAHGSGWYGFALDLEATKRCIDGLEQAARELGRPGGLAGFEISVTPSVRLDRDVARRFADLGVSRLIPLQSRGGVDEQLRHVARLADEVLART